MRPLHAVYNLAVAVAFCVIAPVVVLRLMARDKQLHRQRWSLYSEDIRHTLRGGSVIWFHGASVGEVQLIHSMLRVLRPQYPSHTFLLSTMTPQGHEVASRFEEADAVILAPLDLPVIASRAVKTIRPGAFIVAETELWPNLVRALKRQRVPVGLINGRISSRSYGRYRMLRVFFGTVLKMFDVLCVRSAEDRERFVSLGADPSVVHVCGDMKFDGVSGMPGSMMSPGVLRRSLDIPSEAPVFIAGSTHGGEEERIIQVFRALKNRFPDLVLVLAPRHLHRIAQVEHLLRSQGVPWTRKTSIGQKGRKIDVILLDTMGELASLYSIGTVIVVGGSFCEVGGHNILEVLAHGKGVVFGPHMENFREVARLVVEAGAGVQVDTNEELTDVLTRMLSDPVLREHMGEKGKDLLMQHQGAIKKTINLMQRVLEG